MSTNGEIFYHPAGMSDFSGTTMAMSQQLEQIIQEAEHLLGGSQDFFRHPGGLPAVHPDHGPDQAGHS